MSPLGNRPLRQRRKQPWIRKHIEMNIRNQQTLSQLLLKGRKRWQDPKEKSEANAKQKAREHNEAKNLGSLNPYDSAHFHSTGRQAIDMRPNAKNPVNREKIADQRISYYVGTERPHAVGDIKHRVDRGVSTRRTAVDHFSQFRKRWIQGTRIADTDKAEHECGRDDSRRKSQKWQSDCRADYSRRDRATHTPKFHEKLDGCGCQ